MNMAKATGWTVMHIGLSVRPLPGGEYHGDGTWTGRITGDKASKGFPDLLLVRERILFRELKTDAKSSKVEPWQQEWLDRLKEGGGDADVWRPRDWDDLIVPTLTTYRGRKLT